MKNIFLNLLLLLLTVVNAQNKKLKLISLTANLNYPIAFGNNFLNKGYSADSGYDLAWQINPTKHLFFGLMARKTNEKVINYNLIGDFDSATSSSHYFYIGYRHNIIHQKIYLEHFIGYGNKDITNKSFLSEYNIKGDNSYLIGSRFNYEVLPEFSLFGGVDFNYSTYTINLNGPYKDFYSKSYQFTPTLGIKMSFWNVRINQR